MTASLNTVTERMGNGAQSIALASSEILKGNQALASKTGYKQQVSGRVLQPFKSCHRLLKERTSIRQKCKPSCPNPAALLVKMAA
jgi:hypothetical protein